MRRNSFILILLFSFLMVFSSCNRASSYYEEGNYVKALELLEEKKGLNKDDYLVKINCLVNLGRKEEAKESIMLYLLMSDDSDDRSYVIDLYSDFDFSDILNILLLKETDGINAQILRYISYTELNEIDKAKEILSDYLASNLSILQFATLIVAHPVNIDYVYSFFEAWSKSVTEAEKGTFYSLLFYFLRSDVTDDVAQRGLELLSSLEKDSYFTESTNNQAILYKTKGFICEKLHDNYNANLFWKRSYRLNPNDVEIKNKVQ